MAALLVFVLGLQSQSVAAQVAPYRWYSGVDENDLGGYNGFRHRFQHKSLGPPGGDIQGVEIACGDNPIGEPNIAVNNLLAWLDRPALGDGWWVETYASYRCGAGEGYQRNKGARTTKEFVLVGIKEVPFSDVDVEHEYTLVHNHNLTLTCGTQNAAKAWFMLVDGVKFSCGGFAEFASSAPHASQGQSFLEITNGTFGTITARHHYYGQLQYLPSSLVWIATNFDTAFVDWPPAGGHGDTLVPRDWWHACSGFTETCP